MDRPDVDSNDRDLSEGVPTLEIMSLEETVPCDASTGAPPPTPVRFRLADGSQPEDWLPGHGDRPCPDHHGEHPLDGCPRLFDAMEEQDEEVESANADPHPVVLTVHPRFIRDGMEYEADYEITVEHPATCSGYAEECPVADYLDHVGIDESFHAAFPAPDDLSDSDLAALDGTVRYLTITRSFVRYPATPNGPEEYDADYEFVWSDL